MTLHTKCPKGHYLSQVYFRRFRDSGEKLNGSPKRIWDCLYCEECDELYITKLVQAIKRGITKQEKS